MAGIMQRTSALTDRLRAVSAWIIDLPIRVTLWLCDHATGPLPETEADPAREREEAAKIVRLPRR